MGAAVNDALFFDIFTGQLPAAESSSVSIESFHVAIGLTGTSILAFTVTLIYVLPHDL